MFEFLTIPHWSGIAGFIGIVSLFLAFKKKKGKDSSDLVVGGIAHPEVLTLAERFVLIFKSHEIEPPQIPRFVENITLADLVSNEKLVAVLDEKIISETCSNFNIQKDWLEGKDEPIYPYFTVYKQLCEYVDFLIQLKKKHKHINGFAIKQAEDKLKKNGPHRPIILILRANVNGWEQSINEPIWKYYVIQDEYTWGYWKTRYQLKAMIYVAHAFDIHVAGCQLSKEEIDLLTKGKAFPGPLLKDKSHVAWHPTEYIFTYEESAAVRDHEEVKKVREFIGEDLMGYIVQHSGPIRVFKKIDKENQSQIQES